MLAEYNSCLGIFILQKQFQVRTKTLSSHHDRNIKPGGAVLAAFICMSVGPLDSVDPIFPHGTIYGSET